MVTRAVVENYLNEYGDRADAIAALVADFPALEKVSPFHKRPVIEMLLEDLDSYNGE